MLHEKHREEATIKPTKKNKKRSILTFVKAAI
jgi:hypothetical protein